ncbi:hypothetical protein ACVOMT_10525 [Sphingomonas panni]
MALLHRLLGKAARMVWRITGPRTIGVRALLLDPGGVALRWCGIPISTAGTYRAGA